MAVETFLHPYAQVLAWALVHFLWQGALIGLVAFGLMRLPRFGAATRYTIGVVALGAMLAAPIATAAYLASRTDATIARLGQATISDSSSRAAAPGASTRVRDARALRADSAPARDSSSRSGSGPTGVALILAIWCGGVILLSFRLAGSWLAVRRLVREATRPVTPEIHTLVRRVAGRLALDRVVRVCESTAVVVPVMVGWLKPVVLLPASTISGLAPAQIEALIAHELAHVRRHDYLVNLLQAVVETLLFYHPAVWLLSNHVRTEREHCCDDLAIGVCDRLVYVTALADLAALNSVPRVALAATGGSLLGRVRRILGGGSDNRLPVSGSMSALLVLLVAGILVPISLVSARAAAPAVMPALAPAAVQASTPASPQASTSTTQTTTRGSGNYVWSSGRDKLAIKWTGAFRLADDDKDIEWIEPGESVEVSDDGWVFTTGVVLKGKSDGTIERSFRRNGFVRPYDPEGREYLATALLRVVRKSGFGAESRVARFLKRGGIDAVFTEISQLEGDYARRIYYTELIRQAKLSAADLTRVANDASKTISSDYELATLLKAAAKQNVNDENAVVALIEATRTLQSDYEHHQALSAIVPVKPTTKVASAALTSAVNLRSDYERATFLIEFARRGGLTTTTKPAFLDLVKGMHSSYEQSRVLQTVMGAPDVPADVVADARKASTSVGSDYERKQVLMSSMAGASLSPKDAGGVIESSAGIRSDNEKANVLVALARKGGVSGETAASFFSVVTSISSPYEQHRVIDAVTATPKLDDAVLSPLLKAAASVKGDYDRAEILVRVAKNQTLTTVSRPLYLAAADGIRSDYDQTRVLAELVRSEKTIK